MADNGTKEINFFDLLFVRGEKMLTFNCTLTGRIAFLLENNITYRRNQILSKYS